MQSEAMAADLYQGGGESTRSFRLWVAFAGVAMSVLGTAALIHNGIVTIASVLLFGSFLKGAEIRTFIGCRTDGLKTRPSPD